MIQIPNVSSLLVPTILLESITEWASSQLKSYNLDYISAPLCIRFNYSELSDVYYKALLIRLIPI